MSQSDTLEKPQTEVRPYKNEAFEAYITWRALAGLVVDEEYFDAQEGKTITNKLRQISLQEFCETYNVNRHTVWLWKNRTPDLAARIEARRNEVVPAARISVAYNQLFLLGMQTGDKRAAVEALKTFLGHFGNLQLPVQRQEIKVQSGLLEVLSAAQREGIIEGEIVEPTNIDASASSPAPSALPNPS